MKIDFFIAGTQKSGTSSLKYYLSQHPEVISHDQLECAYFLTDDEFQRGDDFFWKKYFGSNPKGRAKKLVKHSAAIYFNQELARISNSSITKNAKVIVIFRNPVERLFSSYLMEVERSGYSKSLREAVEVAITNPNSIEHKSFLKYGQYYDQVVQLRKYFADSNIHLVLFEDLKKNPQQTIKGLCDKLNLDFSEYDESVFKEVKNDYKVSRSKTIVRLLNKVKQSFLLEKVRNILPSKFKNQINSFTESYLFKSTNRKPNLSESDYLDLLNLYKADIIKFQEISKIETGWLNP